MAFTITSANSQLTLVWDDVFPVPQIIQGYAVDDAFEVESVQPSEAIIGVDALMSAGYTPYLVPFGIMLQADSPSIPTMDAVVGAMAASRETFFANGTLIYPAIRKIFTLTKGSLTDAIILPSAKKLLQPQKFSFKFESIVGAPF